MFSPTYQVLIVTKLIGWVHCKQGWLPEHVTSAVAQGFMLKRALPSVECSAVVVLKFLNIFKTRDPHFHVALGPTNQVAGPDCKTGSLSFPE